MINQYDTCANLRLLAKQIENGESPDFVFCILDSDTVKSAHVATKRPFELLGAMQYRASIIAQEIE
jgi:hypothetical protein